MTEKIDFKKSLDAYQAKRGQFRTVEVPELQYLMIDGSGDPDTSPEFRTAVEALFPVAYALKFASKRQLGRDYVVMPQNRRWPVRRASSGIACRGTLRPDPAHWVFR